MPVSEGQLIRERYRLLERIGDGGMALVFKAEDLLLERVVAIKFLRENLAADEQFLQRFRTEAKAAANLSHPNIAAIYDLGSEQGSEYIVMEYVAGSSLKELIRQGAPLSVERVTAIANQTLAALEHAHGRGLVHRDIKPQNILLSTAGVKVVDFGIAQQLSEEREAESRSVLGTAAYISPEQVRGEAATPQSDLYALGIVLYEALTGRPPFEGDSAVEIARQHRDAFVEPPSQANAGVPGWLDRIILRALAKEPQERFVSAAAMRAAFNEATARALEATTVVPLPPPAPVAATARAAPPAAGVPPATGAAVAGAASGGGRRWPTLMLALAALLLLVVMVPVSYLFYTAILRPALFPPVGPITTSTAVAMASASATAAASPTPGLTPTATATATVTATATSTSRPSPTATRTPRPTATPRFPSWVKYALAGQPVRELVSADNQTKGEVRGMVYESDGDPAKDFLVKIEAEDGGWSAIHPRPGVDPNDGSFRFDQLNPGRYRITLLEKDHKPFSQTVGGLEIRDLTKVAGLGDFKGYEVWRLEFHEVD